MGCSVPPTMGVFDGIELEPVAITTGSASGEGPNSFGLGSIVGLSPGLVGITLWSPCRSASSLELTV
jgi:hypothetical protein